MHLRKVPYTPTRQYRHLTGVILHDNLLDVSRAIEYYQTSDGECPAMDFIDSLSPKERKKVFWVLRLIERLDMVPAEYFKKLTDSQEIWEARIRTSTNTYRLFSFFFLGSTVVFTHGYKKKSQKIDPKEIRRAERYRRDYLERHGRA